MTSPTPHLGGFKENVLLSPHLGGKGGKKLGGKEVKMRRQKERK